MATLTATPPTEETSVALSSGERCGYCYIVKNKLNGMVYVGKRQQSDFNPAYLGSGIYVKRAVNKHGEQNFNTRVLHWANTPLELNLAEMLYIKLYREKYGQDRMYNIARGGEGGCGPLTKAHREKIRKANLGKQLSKEHKRKLSIAASIAVRPPCSDATKEKIRIGNTGKKASLTTRKRMSASGKGKPSHRKGKTLPLETRLKMSASRTGLRYSDAVRRKRSIAVKKSWETRPRAMSQEQKDKLSIAISAARKLQFWSTKSK